MYTVILSYLRPAFLMHKNPHRRKNLIIQWMRPIGCKDESMDLKLSL